MNLLFMIMHSWLFLSNAACVSYFFNDNIYVQCRFLGFPVCYRLWNSVEFSSRNPICILIKCKLIDENEQMVVRQVGKKKVLNWPWYKPQISHCTWETFTQNFYAMKFSPMYEYAFHNVSCTMCTEIVVENSYLLVWMKLSGFESSMWSNWNNILVEIHQKTFLSILDRK